ncbi:MAG: Flp pilus assembly protein CpaB [Alphaproteobacteria bacterium]
MRARTLLLLTLALLLAGGTAWLTREWLAAQRFAGLSQSAPTMASKPARSVLIARAGLKRGQILRPEDLIWQVWPDGALDQNYIELGGPRSPDAFAGWVVRNPIAAGEPITEEKIVAPGDRGFLAAVLTPGMRAISVPVTVTSGISGFIFPGDRVDLVLSYPVPSPAGSQPDGAGNHAHKASQTVLRDVRVIGIDQRLDGKPGEAVVAHTATMEVTPKQGEIIALAGELGKMSLTLRSLVPAPEAEDETGEQPPDSPLAGAASVTLDSDLSPLLPRLPIARPAPGMDFGGPVEENRDIAEKTREPPAPGPVTILRGKPNKTEAVGATGPAEKGS